MAQLKTQQHTQLSFFANIDSTPLDPRIVLSSDARWESCLEKLAKAKVITIDLETAFTPEGNGLDPYRGKIRLIQVYLHKSKEILIFDNFLDKDPDFLEVFQRQIANPDCVKVGHNIYFDLLFLRAQFGWRATNIRDTKILSQIRWCGIKYYRHSLAAVYKRLFGREISKEFQRSDWNQPQLSHSQLNYAAYDVIATYECAAALGHQIIAFNDVPSVLGGECDYRLDEIARVECDAIPAFVELSYNGLPINIEFCQEVIDQYTNAIHDLYQPVQDRLKLPFTAQPIKLAKAVYDVYGIWLLEAKKDIDEEDDDDLDESFEQLPLSESLFETTVYPEIPDWMRVSTSSANLFIYYTQTKEDDLLRLSLVRSLKKCLDSLICLRDSALQNGGYSRSRYNSLGNTSTGRSTSSGDRASSLIAQNQQNLPNQVKHALIKKYNLPAPREVIQAKPGEKLSIIDLAAAHSRYMARQAEDNVLIDTFKLKDSHLVMTATVMNTVNGTHLTADDLIARGGKDDPEIAKFRSLAKTCYYLKLNCGSPNRLQQVFAKDFSDVDIEDCELASKAFDKTFEGVAKYQRNLHRLAQKAIIEVDIERANGGRYKVKYAQFRTLDGRLIHLEAYKKERENKKGEVRVSYEPKINDCTSCMLVSPEAIAEKRSIARILEMLQFYPKDCKLINMVHDEVVLSAPDNELGKKFIHDAYKIISEEFTRSLPGIPSAMSGTEKEALKTLAIKYSEK